jgi:hypothetical protein
MVKSLLPSDNIDHKLVYDLLPYEDDIAEAQKQVIEAQDSLTKAKNDYYAAVVKLSGKPADKLGFSTDSCRARGIRYHVYEIKVPVGGGNRCIFCNSSDIFDL